MNKLVLFDIDGTLIHCGKAPRNAISKAMEVVFGTRGSADHYAFSGKTDSQIVYEVMRLAELDENFVKSNLAVALDQYVNFLDDTLLGEDIKVFDGVVSILNNLRRLEGVTVGLLTGNVVRGAKIKLSRAGIDHFFFNGGSLIGAFGSDAMDRSELPRIAVDRAATELHRHFREKEIVVVGDSPNDVLCGKSLNVCSVAVATGWHKKEELQTYHPDFLFSDLSDTKEFLKVIHN
jgi:phosphoglycolate phosphatase-like HAD superfamily hydrolase